MPVAGTRTVNEDVAGQSGAAAASRRQRPTRSARVTAAPEVLDAFRITRPRMTCPLRCTASCSVATRTPRA